MNNRTPLPAPTALTIAGSDSGAGAGIQADLKTFAAQGVYGTSAITAVTAQNTRGVTAIEAVSPDLVVSQISAVIDDFPVSAIKTGMLATRDIVAAVADRLLEIPETPLVVDPVLVSTSGDRLLDDDAIELIRDRLLPRAHLVTPNRREAEALTGRQLASAREVADAARELLDRGARAVVVTGGDQHGPNAVDLLVDRGGEHRLSAPRIDSRSTHGTGCTYSAAIAARLALGEGMDAAVSQAKRFVTRAIEQAIPLGGGHGPLGHLLVK